VQLPRLEIEKAKPDLPREGDSQRVVAASVLSHSDFGMGTAFAAC
jgi:hypothetical protein